MTIEQHIAAHSSDADALAAYNADPAGFEPVPAHRVIAWMGEGGRIAKLEAFVADVSVRLDTANDAEKELYSGVRAVFLGASNTNTVIEMQQGSKHLLLLGGLVAFGIISIADADALIARGRVEGRQAYTVEQVAARRAALARGVNVTAWIEAKQQADAAASAVIDAHPTGSPDVQAVIAAYGAALVAAKGEA